MSLFSFQVHIQNAAIAGGVAMGASADLLVQPYAALIIGSLAAILSVIGYAYIQVSILILAVAILNFFIANSK